jgi:integrin alpha FG-GAP repeat containing protein 1
MNSMDPPFNGGTPCLLNDPHSSAVLDIDGDCLADVFLHCKPSSPDAPSTYQIWINNKDSGFTLARTGELPPNAGQITFADMDRDGSLDMVFPTCFSISKASGLGIDCSINIVYNQQKPLCPDSVSVLATEGCRPLDALCTTDKDFKFEYDTRNKKVILNLFRTRFLLT